VDAIASGIVTHASAQAATTANLTPVTLSGTGVGKTITNAGAQVAFAVDGYNGIVNDRILVKNQTTPKDNGIYVLTTVGSGATNWVLTRATDFDQASASEVAVGASVIVVNGTANAHTNWVETGQGPFTVDTTAIVFDLVTSSANGSVNTGLINQLGYYAAGGTAISGLATSASGVLVTSAGSVPSISTTLPSGLSATNMTLVTPTIGSATATAINGNTLTAGSWTLTGAASKTLTFNNNLTLAGVDGKTETFNNTLTFAGTDGTTMTFPTTSKTLAANDYSNLTTLTANAFLTGGGAATAPNAVALTGIVKGNGASAPTAVTAPAGAIVGTSDTQNLTNKTNTDPIETAAHVGTTGFTATANTTLQTLAGLDQTFTAAGSYSCEGFLHFTTAPTSSNGAKIALVGDGTVSVTTLMFNAQGLTSTGTPAAFGTATALAGNAFAATVAMTDISFNAAIKINVGGVIHVQLAQNAASGTTASTAGMQRWECHRAS
jgi:hypothetical protein